MNHESRLWDIWCARWGIDPNTSDEEYIDAFLHGREPVYEGVGGTQEQYRILAVSFQQWKRAQESQGALKWRDDAQRDFYAACDAHDIAKARMPVLTRRLQDRAEVAELRRLWLL